MHHFLTAVRRCRAVLVLATLPVSASSFVLADVTTDCFPHRIASFQVGTVSSPPAFNIWQPGIVFGPPGDATPTTGALSVMSLGKGGVIVLEFNESEIVDGPGPDLIVFENRVALEFPAGSGLGYGLSSAPEPRVPASGDCK